MAKNKTLKNNERDNCRKQKPFQRFVQHREETEMIKNLET